METFSALLAICVGNSPVLGEFLAQRPVTRSFDVFFDLRLNKWLSKHSWGWWFETLSHPLWRHRNGLKSSRIKNGNFLLLCQAPNRYLNKCCCLPPYSAKCLYSMSPFYEHGFTEIMVWISNHSHYFVCYVITHPRPNFSGGTAEARHG